MNLCYFQGRGSTAVKAACDEFWLSESEGREGVTSKKPPSGSLLFVAADGPSQDIGIGSFEYLRILTKSRRPSKEDPVVLQWDQLLPPAIRVCV